MSELFDDPDVLKFALLGLLALVGIGFIWVWWLDLKQPGRLRLPMPLDIGIGFVTDFFDTLGIGSFAPTTAMFRGFKTTPDEKIPGTLNVGHTLPTIVEALIFITIINMDMTTLVLLIVASVLGSWMGADIVTRLPKQQIQIGMGSALLVAAVFLAIKVTGAGPGGDTLIGLTGSKLAIAIIGCVLIGALMTIGIGAFAPIMAMVALLGMDGKAAFPIMMGACAFLMPVCSAKFIRAKAYDVGSALGLAIGGVPAVLIAAFIIKSLPLTVIFWLVIAIVTYTGISMLRAGLAKEPSTVPAEPFSKQVE